MVRAHLVRVRLACLAAALPLLAALPAAAQGLSGGGVASKGFSPPVQGVGQKPVQREAAPPGLPGAQPSNSPAPAEVQLDVPPTEALFEAINRGDMNIARDALNRGADINGRNVLGMSPLDLSIDLSRNDITFLLLSMRSQVAVSGPPQPIASSARPPVTRSGRKAVTEAKAEPRRPGLVQPATGLSASTSAQAAQVRYTTVPATPVPQAGFLGFGATSTP